MTTSPETALQRAMIAAAKASAEVAALVGTGVYDLPPQDAAFPFLSLGEVQTLPDDAECLAGAVEIYVTWHGWCRSPGKGGKPAPRPEANALAGALRAALAGVDLDLGAEWALAVMSHRDTRIYIEADGVTAHAVITFRALVDPVMED